MAIKVEGSLTPRAGAGTTQIGEQARQLEELGFDRALTAETSRDPFFPLLLAADRTERLELGTSIVVAFARNPMTVAAQAQDLHIYSGGRFRLGIGSQIKPHITRRFGMPWYGAAKQMREFIEAVESNEEHLMRPFLGDVDIKLIDELRGRDRGRASA